MTWQNYTTPQDVYDRLRVGTQDRLSELLGVPVGSDPLTDSGLQQAIQSANDEVASIVLARYSQPFAVIPPTLRDSATALAIWRLKQRVPYTISESDAKSFDDTMRALREIAEGKRQLLFPPQNQTEALVPSTRVAVSSTTQAQRDFRDALDNF